MSDSDSIIIKRIKKVSGGGHSSAWKVAYADFVTAMMAFFLLLWLLSTATEEQLAGVSEYFTPNFGFSGGRSRVRIERVSPQDTGEMNASGQIEKVEEDKDKDKDKDKSKIRASDDDAYLRELKGEIEKFVSQVYLNSNINIKTVPDGIAIEITDNTKSSFLFGKNQIKINENAKKYIDDLLEILWYVPRYITLEGFSSMDEDRKWWLSVMRAEEFRKYFSDKGLSDRIAKISGSGAFELIDKMSPASPRNRRIVITLIKDSVMPLES